MNTPWARACSCSAGSRTSATASSTSTTKLTFADDYKTRPPDPRLSKNDTSFIASALLTF